MDDKVINIAAWYRDAPERPLSESTRALFAFTNPKRFPRSLPEDDLVKHIVECRNSRYEKTPYPCLGRFAFLNPGSEVNPRYEDAIEYLKADPKRKVLDMGCGYGQDVRSWLRRGVRPEQIVAADLLIDFVDDGCALFGDEIGKGHLDGVKFESCDIFKKEDVDKVRKLSDGGFDVVYIGSFVHLFDIEGQRKCVDALASLISDRPGSFTFGRQSGMPYGKAGAFARVYKTGAKGDNVGVPYRHDPDTFKELWQEFAPKGKPWKAQCRIQEGATGNWSGLNEEQRQEYEKDDPVVALGVGIDFSFERP